MLPAGDRVHGSAFLPLRRAARRNLGKNVVATVNSGNLEPVSWSRNIQFLVEQVSRLLPPLGESYVSSGQFGLVFTRQGTRCKAGQRKFI